MQKKQYLCKRITKKKTALLCFAGGEQSEENESVLCLSKDPERGKHFYFSSAKVLLLFDICKFFRLFLEKKLIFMYN